MVKKKKAAPRKKPAAKKRPSPKPKKKLKAPAKGKKPSKKAAAPKKAPPPKGAGDELGRVVAFFRIPVVAVIKLTKGGVKVGDQIWLHGHTTDLKVKVASMQINHQPIKAAKKGDEFGLKVASRCRIGDHVYQIAS